MFATPASQTFLGEGASRHRAAIGNKNRVTGNSARDNSNLRHARTVGKDGFDLAQMNSIASDLKLAITAANELKHAARQKATEVTGSETGFSRKSRRGAEAGSGQRLVPPVAGRQRWAGHEDFADLPGFDSRAIVTDQFYIDTSWRKTNRDQCRIERRRMVYAP
jgi:hypothetical protein